jgi:tRNA threonylcarbamoyladenosine biosynthesis protein TsaB
VSDPDTPRLLILETSGRVASVALAAGDRLLGGRRLEEARRHARDLAPAVAGLLAAQGWRPRDVHAVLVSRGPGSYTGLRVGVTSAKAFAYATGCALLAVDTFAAVALQAPPGCDRLDVLADAQQDRVYFQPFLREGDHWRAEAALTIVPLAEWLARRRPDASVTGPGLKKWEAGLPPEVHCVEEVQRDPQPASLLHLGLARYRAGERDDVWAVEPLYLRPSSAEEQMIHRKDTKKSTEP